MGSRYHIYTPVIGHFTAYPLFLVEYPLRQQHSSTILLIEHNIPRNNVPKYVIRQWRIIIIQKLYWMVLPFIYTYLEWNVNGLQYIHFTDKMSLRVLVFLVVLVDLVMNQMFSATSNPHIRSGFLQLVSGAGNYANYYGNLIESQNVTVYYEVTFEKALDNVPSVAIGITTYQYDLNSVGSTSPYRVEMRTPFISTFYFTLGLKNFGDTANWIKQFTIMYMAMDVSKIPEIVIFSNYFHSDKIGSYGSLKNIHTLAPSYNPPLMFWKSITAHQFIQNTVSSLDIQIVSSISQFNVTISNMGGGRVTNIGYTLIGYQQQTTKIYLLNTVFPIVATSQFSQDYLAIMGPIYRYPHNTFMVGLTSIQATQYEASKFSGYSLDLVNGVVSIKPNPAYQSASFDILYTFVLACQKGYYDSQNLRCVDTCPTSYHLNYAVCLTCIAQCHTCRSSTVCFNCTENRSLYGGNCVCAPQFYSVRAVQGQKCVSCGLVAVGCTTCDPSTCSQCSTDRGFSPLPTNINLCSCISYSSLNETSKSCDCFPGYYLDAGQCLICSQSCVTCSVVSTNCHSCFENVYRVAINGECLCQNQFVELCTTSDTACNASACYFDTSISVTLELVSLTKDPDSNTMHYSINILPHLEFLSRINIDKVLSLGLIETPTINNFNYQNGLLTFDIELSQDNHQRQTQIQLNLIQQQSVSFSQASTYSYPYFVTPQNNVEAKYFHPMDYAMIIYLPYILYVLIGLAAIIFVLGMYSSKLIVSEMMGILQASYFGLFFVDIKYPMLPPLAFLKYSSGFNYFFTSQRGNVPSSISNLGYYQVVYDNLNIMVFLIVIPLTLSFIFGLMFKLDRRLKSRNLSYCKLFMGEWSMVVIIFNLYNLSASTTAFARYVTTRNETFTMSLVEISLCFFLVLLSIALYILGDYNYFGQFKYMFKWKTFDLVFYLIYIGIRIVIGAVCGGLSNFGTTPAIIAGIFLVVSLITAVQKPFADNLHTIRSSVNFFIAFMIFTMYALMSINGVQSGKSIHTKFPFIIVCLLYLVVFMALGYVIRQLIADRKMKIELQQPSNIVQKQSKKHEQFMRQQIESIMKEPGEKSFAKKLFLSKNKKPKKRKVHRQEIQQSIQSQKITRQQLVENMEGGVNEMLDDNIILNDIMKRRESIPDLQNVINAELSAQKIEMVNQMLKEGLI